jgi:hypothetical protein
LTFRQRHERPNPLRRLRCRSRPEKFPSMPSAADNSSAMLVTPKHVMATTRHVQPRARDTPNIAGDCRRFS